MKNVYLFKLSAKIMVLYIETISNIKPTRRIRLMNRINRLSKHLNFVLNG